jgi:hypothetical protein
MIYTKSYVDYLFLNSYYFLSYRLKLQIQRNVMKKFLFVMLTVLTAISVFAEPYSKEKYKSLNNSVDERKYCFEA